MVNEDIVTALKNAINNGEALDTAVQIMINSGYNSKEVYEASQFVGSGVINSFGDLQSQQQNQIQPTTPQPLQQYPIQQIPIQIQQPIQTSQINKQPKKSYTKEIILVIILIILMGVLGATIFFRERILGFFS